VTHRHLICCCAAACLALAVPASSMAADAAGWKPATLSDSQPDVHGFWRPERGGTYSLLLGRVWGGGTAEILRIRELEAEGKPLPNWPSRIVDPADGQIPYQPWARAKQKQIEANVDHPTKQEHLDPQERCFPDGPVRAALLTGMQIEQYPGYVVLSQEANHTFRVIPLDGRHHAPEGVTLWMGDSRGHWEGNTLVVDVTNNNSKGRLDRSGNFASDKVHITERYIFGDKDSFEYRVTFDDPSIYTRPWTLSAKFLRDRIDDPGYEAWEQECQEHENNTTALSKLIDAAGGSQELKTEGKP